MRLWACTIHGLFDSDGSRHIDRLAPYFDYRGYTTKTDLDYKWSGVFTSFRWNETLANFYAAAVPPGKWAYGILVAHSNGCAIAIRAAELNPDIKQLVLIHPAVDRGRSFPPSLQAVHIYYSDRDRPTWFARFVPGSEMGDMGRVGWKPKTPHIGPPNIFQTNDRMGHSDILHEPHIRQYGPEIVEAVERVRTTLDNRFLL